MRVTHITVADCLAYAGAAWRDAILNFTKNIHVWGTGVWMCPTVLFECGDGTQLMLVMRDGRYWAYGDVAYVEHEMQMPVIDAGERVLVERALMRLTETGMPVTILLRADAHGVSTATLWTDREGDELHVSGYHLPSERDVFHEFAGGRPFSEVH